MKRLAIDQKIRLYRPRWFRKEYRRKVGAICSKMHITDFLTYFLRCFGRKTNPPGKVCNWFWSFHDIRQHLWIAFWDFLRVSTLEKKIWHGRRTTYSGPQIWIFFETQLQRIFWTGLLGMKYRNLVWAKFRHRRIYFQSYAQKTAFSKWF